MLFKLTFEAKFYCPFPLQKRNTNRKRNGEQFGQRKRKRKRKCGKKKNFPRFWEGGNNELRKVGLISLLYYLLVLIFEFNLVDFSACVFPLSKIRKNFSFLYFSDFVWSYFSQFFFFSLPTFFLTLLLHIRTTI